MALRRGWDVTKPPLKCFLHFSDLSLFYTYHYFQKNFKLYIYMYLFFVLVVNLGLLHLFCFTYICNLFNVKPVTRYFWLVSLNECLIGIIGWCRTSNCLELFFLTFCRGIFIQTLADASHEKRTLSALQITLNVCGFCLTVAATVFCTVYAKRRLKQLQEEDEALLQ